jgi:heat shock protein HslJ
MTTLHHLSVLIVATSLTLTTPALTSKLNAEEPDPQVAKLLQGSWVVEKIGDRTLTKQPRPTLIVNPKNEIYGDTSINRYGGQLNPKGSPLLFGPMRSTLRAGDEEFMELENQWKAVLQKASQVKRDKDQLQLLEGDHILATLKGVNMTGEWKLTKIGDSLIEDIDHELSLVIAEDGKVNGNTGVNLLMGQLSTDQQKLFGTLATTRRAGAPEMMQRENTFLDALRKSNRFEVDGVILTLLEDDEILLQFQTAKSSDE